MKKTVLAALALIPAIILAGCGGPKESWAYIHDPQVEILSMSDNGKAEYKGQDYRYTKDDTFITLTGKDGTVQKHRYIPDDKGMVFYESSTYDYDGEGSPNGIVGVWTQENGWLFQFTEGGTFSEENIFHGHYAVDEDAHTIKLMYDDPIEDAILYYDLEGDKLTIEYPWPMVPTGSQEGTVKGKE